MNPSANIVDRHSLYEDTKWVLQQHRPHLLAYIICTAFMLCESGLRIAEPLAMKWMLDYVLPRRWHAGVLLVVLFYCFSYACKTTFSRIGGFQMWKTQQKIALRLRMQMLKRLQKASASYYDTVSVGDVMERFGEAGDIADIGEDIFMEVLRVIVICIGSLIVLASFNHLLAWVVVPVIPVLVGARRVYSRKLQQVNILLRTIKSRLSTFLQEHLSIAIQLQLLRREQTHSRKYAAMTSQWILTDRERKMKEMVYGFASRTPIQLGLFVLFGVGGWQVASGVITIGAFVAAYGYILQVFDPLLNVANIDTQIQRSRTSVARVREILEMALPVAEKPMALRVPLDGAAGLRFENVTFGYREGRETLKETSFDIAPGERVALVGRSGSGKSTIAKLAVRLYDAHSGTIWIDGDDVRNLQLRSLRTAIAILPQEPSMFDGTIRENLLYGRLDATEDELMEAAHIAQIDKKIMSLPSQWDERIGSAGKLFSGGERQRLALARTLLQRPRLLILDECTSAVDGKTEKAILQGLARLRGVTTIIISHRMSAVEWADRVIVLSEGRCEELQPGQYPLAELGAMGAAR